MIHIEKGSDTVIIVIHEIYGVNKHMERICKSLAEKDLDVICPNLLERELSFDYTQEEVAYRYFMENVGFTNASHMIKSVVRDHKVDYKKVFIVGFSVGATIAWTLSEEDDIDGVVGYYGSRIRNHVEISPQCPTLLLFSEEEHSFNVDELIVHLDKKNVEIHKFRGQHGFSDPYSPTYNVKSAQIAFSKIVDFILQY